MNYELVSKAREFMTAARAQDARCGQVIERLRAKFPDMPADRVVKNIELLAIWVNVWA
jgi:hypothetical protein